MITEARERRIEDSVLFKVTSGLSAIAVVGWYALFSPALVVQRLRRGTETFLNRYLDNHGPT